MSSGVTDIAKSWMEWASRILFTTQTRTRTESRRGREKHLGQKTSRTFGLRRAELSGAQTRPDETRRAQTSSDETHGRAGFPTRKSGVFQNSFGSDRRAWGQERRLSIA